ncbi:nucleotide-diphospho-sugar transferase [Synechococcus sp. CBW1107]|uniref:nucleotide-diphospho-sugar transferase n=1 Tax=Synechococcus sp. CBW1107 TaxID=2789857 RepID=UPI002AD424AC|nr:nucleotide-diphospho-sugar transferase [Synechococcus sp. CBW1107]CAK6687483.1 hypothetical protein MNNICLKF_00226 [Synechococcus sp. CBW1107]
MNKHIDSNPNGFDTPLLIIAWRRPDTLLQVINSIRSVTPSRIFFACDGPNPTRLGEIERVEATRAVFEREIDWPCTIQRLYAGENQGCRVGVSRAIDWFFEHVEEGIVLEDDCVPHQDFFPYCANLLKRYRHDKRIWCISGNNFQNGLWRGDGSYYFSRYNHCWGWATWRRCWENYDQNLSQWPNILDFDYLMTIFEDPIERHYWRRIWQRLMTKNEPDSWAYRWTLTCLANGGLTILPNRNLVRNIGFGEDATHTTCEVVNTDINMGIHAIEHPSLLLRDAVADRYTFDNVFGGKWQRFPLSLIWLFKRVLSKASLGISNLSSYFKQ